MSASVISSAVIKSCDSFVHLFDIHFSFAVNDSPFAARRLAITSLYVGDLELVFDLDLAGTAGTTGGASGSSASGAASPTGGPVLGVILYFSKQRFLILS